MRRVIWGTQECGRAMSPDPRNVVPKANRFVGMTAQNRTWLRTRGKALIPQLATFVEFTTLREISIADRWAERSFIWIRGRACMLLS